MNIFLTSLAIVLYLVALVSFAAGFKTVRAEGLGHLAVFGALCAIPVLVGLLIQTNIN